MKFKTFLGAAAASLLVAGAVIAQPYGWGMGPAMMGGQGPYGGMYGMGPGMMWGSGGGYASLNLSDEQRKKIADIQTSTHKAMWEMQLEARRQIDAVLTQEQRDQLRR